MPRTSLAAGRILSEEARAKLRDGRAFVERLSLDRALVLDDLAACVRDVLDTEKGLILQFAPRGEEGLSVENGGTAGIMAGALDRTDEWLADKMFGWTGFNPIRPEPWQRNVVMGAGEVMRIIGAQEIPLIMRDLFPKIGLHGRDQMRVLVCEGPSLVAWVGALQPGTFDRGQRILFEGLAPALRRRLLIERRLGGGRLMRGAFLAALDRIGSPAFLVSARGRMLETNALGRVALSGEGRALRDGLADAARRADSDRFAVTRVSEGGVPDAFLLVTRDGADGGMTLRMAHAAKRWALSPRQTHVLTLVAEGRSNRAIAAVLEIAERTVESHLTAIYERAQVEGRSELLAALSRR